MERNRRACMLTTARQLAREYMYVHATHAGKVARKWANGPSVVNPDCERAFITLVRRRDARDETKSPAQ